MPITKNDIKLLESQKMDDTDEGGGRVTGTVILDGDSNNIFPDISELDRTYGRVNLRKVYPAVLTPSTDTYYGANLIIELPTTDPAVDALLFTTKDWNDQRVDAQNHLEKYTVAGPVGPWFLYDAQVSGAKQILMFSRVGAEVPEVGDVLYLVENEGQAGEYSQFVRVTDVSSENRTFTDDKGEFTRQVITCGLSDALRDTYHGATISRYDTITPDASLRTTVVADAAQYFGVKPLTVAAGIGDTEITVKSVYGQLVPSTRAESPVTDQPLPYKPVSITSGAETFEIIGPSHTHAIDVTLGNRAYSYVATLLPIPSPGNLVVEYRALGKWYRIEDQGDGTLDGSGSGSVNYQTGAVSVTLEALPDVGSMVIFTWGTTVHYTDRAGAVISDLPLQEIALAQPAIPATVTFSWTSGGQTKTASVSVSGNITGDATGMLTDQSAWMRMTAQPDANSQITVDYDEPSARKTEADIAPTVNNGVASFTLNSTDIKPGTVELTFDVAFDEQYVTYENRRKHVFYDDATGNDYWTHEWVPVTTTVARKTTLVVRDNGAGELGPGGTIDYATGACTVAVEGNELAQVYDPKTGTWSQSQASYYLDSTIDAAYLENSVTPGHHTEQVNVAPLQFDLLPGLTDRIVAGTLRFNAGGQAYSDRAGGGVLYLDDGTVAGSVNYEAGFVTLDVHSGVSNLSVNSLVSTYGQWSDYSFFFRTNGSPIQPGSLIFNATALDGTALSENSDANGIISSATAEGEVEQEMGVVKIKLGALVADSSLTPEEKQEPWYDPADIDSNGNIWKPIFVDPNTVKHAEVVYKYLPLDADILGLDPVRLPTDGRVPIYRPGNVVVIHNTDTVSVASPSNGDVVDCGRVRLARVRLVADDGTEVAEADYTADLDAGTVTLDNITGYTAPIAVYHTVADMVMVTDVRIDGVVTLGRGVTHDYPADTSYLSSALLIGDRWAYYNTLFDQETWTGEWDDAVIGNPANGTFNDTTYPITTSNDGAIEERWRCQFLNTTEVAIYGEHVGGLTLAGENRWAIANDIAPVNPNTGKPYFTIPAAGWGAGWATGNVLRFNTAAANYPVWIARCIQQSDAAVGSDKFCIQIRGDIDA